MELGKEMPQKEDPSLSSKNYCLNPECRTSLNLIKANTFAQVYYSASNKQQICENCLKASDNHLEVLCNKFQNSEPVVEHCMPAARNIVTLSDSDDSDVAGNESGAESVCSSIECDPETIDEDICKILDSLDFQNQILLGVNDLDVRISKLQDGCEEIIKIYDDVEKRMDLARNEFYQAHNPTIKDIGSIEIFDVNSSKLFVHNFGPRKVPDSSLNKLVKNGKEETDVVAVARYHGSSTLPPLGPLVKRPFQTGDPAFSMRENLFDIWQEVQIIEILDVPGQRATYRIKTETTTNRPAAIRLVSGKYLAYSSPSPTRLSVGTRIIGLYQDRASADHAQFYSGIIAEPPKIMNKYRYLVFFDDGYAQYVTHNDIRVISDASKDAWEDVHPDSKMFIKKYLEKYPERAMVKLQPGQLIKAELNGKWYHSKVLEVDCSLVKMSFESQSYVEWIYRGSTRLGPLFNEQMRQEQQGFHRHRYHRFLDPNKRKNMPYVEYTRGTDDAHDELASKRDLETGNQVARKHSTQVPVRAVAKKSTTKKSDEGPLDLFPELLSEHEGTINYRHGLVQLPKSRFKPHQCSHECVEGSLSKLQTINQENPLLVPIHLGWERQIFRHRAGAKRFVNYRAPCGRKLRTIDEVFRYLRVTQCSIGIDLFCFDFWVKIFGEFKPSQVLTQIEDITEGVENTKISCVNSLNTTLPKLIKYSTVRTPTRGVHLNLDSEFLAGCDCEDDCQDKEKCSCWQLTIQGTAYNSDGRLDDKVGYEYRRLRESVVTGIYECYGNCKCNPKTCLNRVVQHPLQVRLQLFKTQHKGWGLRCLDDLPQGNFICIYAGQLLTEQGANEEGKAFGDEYLAELDYIEVIENLKDGYESDVLEEDDVEVRSERPTEATDLRSEGSSPNEEDFEDEDKMGKYDDEEFRPLCRSKRTASSMMTRSQSVNSSNLDSDDLQEIPQTEGRRASKKREHSEQRTTTVAATDQPRTPSKLMANEIMRPPTPKPKYLSARELFGEEEFCYIMDARNTGNIGRYLNHSCCPNVFVQNVFVDTHDVRFPWVAFFALTYIRAGTELTWDYSYEVGSVPNKIMYCYCGSSECRGRLL